MDESTNSNPEHDCEPKLSSSTTTSSSSSSKTSNKFNPKTLIPRDIHDFTSVQNLATTNPSKWEPVSFEILSWMAAPNWPIALDVGKLFLDNPQNLTDCVPKVLAYEGDDDWVLHVLQWVVFEVDNEYSALWLKELKQFQAKVTDEIERDYGIREDLASLIKELEDEIKGSSTKAR